MGWFAFEIVPKEVIEVPSGYSVSSKELVFIDKIGYKLLIAAVMPFCVAVVAWSAESPIRVCHAFSPISAVRLAEVNMREIGE